MLILNHIHKLNVMVLENQMIQYFVNLYYKMIKQQDVDMIKKHLIVYLQNQIKNLVVIEV